MKTTTIIIVILLSITLFFRTCFGIFVIQPIGMIPEGTSIVYWRVGLNLPFIASADGLLDENKQGVSLFGRAIMLGFIENLLIDRKIVKLPYSESLYSISTGGKEYSK